VSLELPDRSGDVSTSLSWFVLAFHIFIYVRSDYEFGNWRLYLRRHRHF
jgi:hypothetical protein